MLISNNYFPTLAQDNVDLVTEGIEEVTANGDRLEDRHHP